LRHNPTLQTSEALPMKTLRISAAALIIGFTGYAGAALAQQTTPPPAQTTTTDSFNTAPAPVQDPAAQPTPDPAPQADSATTSASPTSATAPDEATAADPATTPKAKAKAGKKHKQPSTDQPSPDAPK
jgi:cytoskeletal protein RodZ